ncbi:MAG: lysophospholipid acyltransferase family protein [Proteobacteria bacterium]|nr:lysophospholipid acyltransferase family protein [Pseudomonadota bacterium]
MPNISCGDLHTEGDWLKSQETAKLTALRIFLQNFSCMRTPLLCLRLSRLCRLISHFAKGLIKVTFRFPSFSLEERVNYIQKWSKQLTHILGVKLRIQGIEPGQYPGQHMLLANHISWLDIFVLDSVTVSRFVAKAELRSWPVIGRLCIGSGTLFIERDRKRDTARVNEAIVAALNEGHCVTVFPEGTTGCGRQLLPFRSSLLQAAIDGRATIQPVYLRYTDSEGKYSDAATYIGDMTIAQSVWRILGTRSLHAEINFLAPFPTEHANRRTLTQFVEARICTAHHALNAQSSNA